MGWTETYYHSKLSYSERKEELDVLFTFDGITYKHKVLKSTIKNNVYYAAVEVINSENNNREVFAAVCLLSQRADYPGMWYGYKDMCDTCGPVVADCPISILNLLTETDNETANAWRKRCRDNAQKPNLSKLPTGTKIRFVCPWDCTTHKKGQTVELTKTCTKHSGNRKTYKWLTGMYFWKQSQIPKTFEVIT